MLKNLRIKLISMLSSWLTRLTKQDNEFDHKQRLNVVRDFFHLTLPEIDEKFRGKAIIEQGTFNYFLLPSGGLPKYDFVLPEIPLYVVVPGILSASWPEARQRGVSRIQWESHQFDLSAIERETKLLATIGLAAEPRLMVIRWDEPVNHLQLADRLQELLV